MLQGMAFCNIFCFFADNYCQFAFYFYNLIFRKYNIFIMKQLFNIAIYVHAYYRRGNTSFRA